MLIGVNVRENQNISNQIANMILRMEDSVILMVLYK